MNAGGIYIWRHICVVYICDTCKRRSRIVSLFSGVWFMVVYIYIYMRVYTRMCLCVGETRKKNNLCFSSEDVLYNIYNVWRFTEALRLCVRVFVFVIHTYVYDLRYGFNTCIYIYICDIIRYVWIVEEAYRAARIVWSCVCVCARACII